ncbi:hypothetical protein U9M48_011145 [Paspalum notatum var. saurae]|uniref:Uncharacterized protein n=1 Tax=Paspalum notatum var. saurae TaxID=547442 RepID=A0AAQ3SUY4_PASNO
MAPTAAITGGGQQVQVLDGSNPEVGRMRQLIGSRDYSAEGWSQCWKQGVTPWDLGQPTPAVVELVNSGTLPSSDGDAATVLVPGCGACRDTYDVVALSGPGRFVYGLDISEAAIDKAKQILLCCAPIPKASMGKENGAPAEARWRAHYPYVSGTYGDDRSMILSS